MNESDWAKQLEIIRIALFGKKTAADIEDGTLMKRVKERVKESKEGGLGRMTNLCDACSFLVWTREPKVHVHSDNIKCDPGAKEIMKNLETIKLPEEGKERDEIKRNEDLKRKILDKLTEGFKRKEDS
jgi:hypothetical protein